MKTIVKRLTRGMDLKEEIEKVVKDEGIEAGVILSAVGCVSTGKIRLADGESIKTIKNSLEILSLQGTLGLEGLHLHISFGDLDGLATGGHLVGGNIINTTCELVIGVLLDLSFQRRLDKETGYNELTIKKR